MENDTKTSDVLNRAADLIEERGWQHGGGWNEGTDAPLCLEGGIMAAAGIDRDDSRRFYLDCPAYDAVVAYLGKNPTPKSCPISDAVWGWNDARNRTAEEVVEVLRAAAVIEAARENAAVEVSA